MTHSIPALLSRAGVCARKLSQNFRESCGYVVRKNKRKVALICNKSLAEAKLYYDLKDARDRCRDAGNVKGALPWLTRNTICIRCLTACLWQLSQDRSRDHLQARPPSLALWMPILRALYGCVRFVGVHYRCDARDIAIVCKSLPAQWSIVSDTLPCHIWGPCEALVVILGGSDASDGCYFTWYRIERAVSTSLPPISGTTAGKSQDAQVCRLASRDARPRTTVTVTVQRVSIPVRYTMGVL